MLDICVKIKKYISLNVKNWKRVNPSPQLCQCLLLRQNIINDNIT